MKVDLSRKLIAAYSENNKNPNYSLAFALNSIDPNICPTGVLLPDSVSFGGETTPFDVDDKNIQIMTRLFKSVDAALVERLLWVALLFPEM